MPVKAENSSTLLVVQNAFCEYAGAALMVWLGPVVLAHELPRLRRGEADCLNLAIG